ncbi:hypothetical protein P389DRAFT_192081 [Cystobasidium minutum MCA 4210]|uniref:uncharacterized protein n=1 Tax=Cystobasidium minutum MCA 4210 TaxID=1397322 RepID=UPI0034CD2CD1|eukprot:jgi/Rhomi1/192081/gm1.295_g
MASPAVNVMDWTAQQVARFGEADTASSSDGVHAASGWQFIDCGDVDDALEIKSLKVVPDPPVPGKTMTIYAEGTAKQRIEKGAYADVIVKLGLIKLLTKRFDICEELQNANASMKCPIEKGEHTIVQSVDLPAEIPKAKFVVNAQAWTQPPENPMGCATIVIDFMDRN